MSFFLVLLLLLQIIVPISLDDTLLATIFLQGISQHNSGDYQGCVETFRQYTLLFPQTDFGWTNQGVCLEKQHLWKESIGVYLNCLSVLPQNVNCLNAACTVYLVIGGNDEEVNATCGKVVELDPLNSRALHNWGVVLVNRFEYVEGVKYLQEAWKADPNDIKSLSNLCNALCRGGWCDWSLQNSTILLALSPTSSNYAGVGIYRSTCLPFDRDSINLKLESFRLRLLEVGSLRTQLGLGCSRWNLGLDFPKKLRVPLGGEGVYEISGPHVPPGEVLSSPLSLRYEEKVVSLVKLNNVYMEGEAGVFYQDDPICTIYTGDHLWSARLNTDWSGIPYQTNSITDPVATPLQHNMGNHYHLMVEVLSRIIVFREFLTSKIPIVKLLLPFSEGTRSHMEQIILLLGIRKEEYIEYLPRKDMRYHFQTLWTVDWRVKDLAQVSDSWSVYFPPKAVLRLTSKTVLESLGLEEDPLPSLANPGSGIPADWNVLYITRNDTGVRTVLHESLFVEALRERIGPERVRIFSGKNLPFLEQIRMFHGATVVVGPHGAGLANLLWCREGTGVVQFPLEPHVDTCFGHLASAKGLDYWVTPKLSAYYYGQFNLTPSYVSPLVELVVQLLERRGVRVGRGKEEL